MRRTPIEERKAYCKERGSHSWIKPCPQSAHRQCSWCQEREYQAVNERPLEELRFDICCQCHNRLDKEARGLYCSRCWIAYVRTFNPQEARILEQEINLPPEQLTLFI